MKKIILALVIVASLIGTIVLASCLGKNQVNANKFEDLNQVNSVYAFSAASAGMIISAEGLAPGAVSVDDKQTPPTAQPEVTEDYSELDGYMTLVGSLLSDGAFEITESASDREGYTHKTVVTFTNIDGTKGSYEMHYVTFDHETETETDDDDDFGAKTVETEEEYKIKGVLVIDGVDYAIRGEVENETEGTETENETKFFVELSEGRYMLVERSFENEDGEIEQEYRYSIFKDGKLVEECAFEYEIENDETEVKMTTLKDGSQQAFYFEKEVEYGRDVLKLRVGATDDDDDNAKLYIVKPVTNEDGTVSYEYKLIKRD